MPVKVDNSQFDADMFDTEFFSDFDNSFANDSCLANIFEDMLMTPPQSPGTLGMSMIDMMDEITNTENGCPKQLLHHDCMWSASCSNPQCSNSIHTLSSSPLSTSRYLLDCPSSLTGSNGISNESCDVINSVEDLYSVASSLTPTSSNDSNSNVFALSAMENDHAYGSPALSQMDLESDTDSMFSMFSGVDNSSVAPQTTRITIKPSFKITKIKASNGIIKKGKLVKKQQPTAQSLLLRSGGSLLNNNASKTVVKPTIIVASDLNLNEAARKLNMEIRNKKKVVVTEIDAKPVSDVKKMELSGMSPMISPSSSDSEESLNSSGMKTAGPFRRREHNDSERKRRDHLRNSFNVLKEQVPKLKTLEKKAPRIMILAEATAHVKELTRINEKLENEYNEKLRKKAKLEAILKKYQSMMA